jgi:hypothetical protein
MRIAFESSTTIAWDIEASVCISEEWGWGFRLMDTLTIHEGMSKFSAPVPVTAAALQKPLYFDPQPVALSINLRSAERQGGSDRRG